MTHDCMLEIDQATLGRACSNRFFDMAKRATPTNLELLVREWFPVTQAFCLGLWRYCALIAGQIDASEGDRRTTLERAMLTPAAIAAEEFGSGRHGLSGIHYRMFSRLGEPFGISLEELRNNEPQIEATKDLVAGINQSFNDLYLGAGCIRTVEASAYSIVEAMNYVFTRSDYAGISDKLTSYELEYITLHLVIEKEHDDMTKDFIGFLAQEDEAIALINTSINNMDRLFGDFWDKLSHLVFAEE